MVSQTSGGFRLNTSCSNSWFGTTRGPPTEPPFGPLLDSLLDPLLDPRISQVCKESSHLNQTRPEQEALIHLEGEILIGIDLQRTQEYV